MLYIFIWVMDVANFELLKVILLIDQDFIWCFLLYGYLIYLFTLKVLIRGIHESNLQNSMDFELEWKN